MWGVSTSRGETDRSVMDIRGTSLTTEERQEKMTATAFLKDVLADGRTVRVKEVWEEAEQAYGFSRRTIARARVLLDVKCEQRPTGPKRKNEWWLYLPQSTNASEG